MDLMLIDLLESSKAIGLCPMGNFDIILLFNSERLVTFHIGTDYYLIYIRLLNNYLLYC